MGKLLFAVFLVLCSGLPSVYAAQTRVPGHDDIIALFESSGMILSELLSGIADNEMRNLERAGAIRGERPHIAALVTGSMAETALIQELDNMLAAAFHRLAHEPSEDNIDASVQELYYVYMKHVGSAILNSEQTAAILKGEIRRFVQPKGARTGGSCELHLESASQAVH